MKKSSIGNIKLREILMEDAEYFALYVNNENIIKNFRDAFPRPYRVNDAVEFFTKCLAKERPENLIKEADGHCIGEIGYDRQSDVERYSAEIGYWIAEPYWNKGIMTDIINRFAQYVFENTDIIRLYANVFEPNKASIKALEKAGFEKVGLMKKAVFKNGKFVDMVMLEKIKE